MRKLLAVLCTIAAVPLFSSEAKSQGNCPPIVTGAILTAAQWQACFTAKQDVLGFNPLNLTGGTLTGKLGTAASTTVAAGLNLLPGVAPTSPVNGDFWTTGGGVFARIGGSTINIAAGGLGYTPLNKAGDTMTGRLGTVASSAFSGAGFTIPQGAAPASPANGDVWTTSDGLFVQINGVTVGPIGISSALRIQALGTVVIFVNGSLGTDNATCGVTSGVGACKTIQFGWNRMVRGYDLRGNSCSLSVATGTYNESVVLAFGGTIVGTSICSIEGNRTTPSNVTISIPDGQPGIYAKDLSETTILGIRFQRAGSGTVIGIQCEQTGVADFADVEFGDMGPSGIHIYGLNYGRCNSIGNKKIVGDAKYHIAVNGGQVQSNSATTTTIDTPRAFAAYAASFGAGIIDATGETITGAGVSGTTGNRFIMGFGGKFYTGTNNLNFFPGSLDGLFGDSAGTNTGGSYDGFSSPVNFISPRARNYSDNSGMLIAPTVASNNLTVAIQNVDGAGPTALEPVTISFRSQNTSAGNSTPVGFTAAMAYSPTPGSTFGATSGVETKLTVVVFSNGVVGLVNVSPAGTLDERNVASAVSGGGNSLDVIYASATVTSLPFKIIGSIQWTMGLAAAGVYNVVPDLVSQFGPGIAPPRANKARDTKFGQLPSPCTGLLGTIVFVIDSMTNTWGATITGGGMDGVFAGCNGTNWTVVGK